MSHPDFKPECVEVGGLTGPETDGLILKRPVEFCNSLLASLVCVALSQFLSEKDAAVCIGLESVRE